MLKRILFLTALLISACVTVNIYFPAAAVERAADQIVKETWGGGGEPAKNESQPQSYDWRTPARIVSLSLVGEAQAQGLPLVRLKQCPDIYQEVVVTGDQRIARIGLKEILKDICGSHAEGNKMRKKTRQACFV